MKIKRATFKQFFGPSILLVSLIGLSACASTPSESTALSSVQIDSDFSGGHYSEHTLQPNGVHRLVNEPEVHPINNSPWYAFRLRTDTAQSVPLELFYRHGTHRYVPKIAKAEIGAFPDLEDWSALPADALTISEDGSFARFTVEVPENKFLYVAGQPIFRAKDLIEPIAALAETTRVIGFSVEQRPLIAFESAVLPDKPIIIVVGGQHPPEVPGHLAVRVFLETLLGDSVLANDFREQFGIVALPLVNPDGLEAGHWRTNCELLDSNRHWGGDWEATEPREVSQYLSALPGPAAFFIDFHATRRNIFYTFEPPYPTDYPGLQVAWLESINEAYPELDFEIRKGHNPGLNVSRLWGRKVLNCDSLTFEFGDREPWPSIRETTEFAARGLMRRLLEATKQD